LRRGYAIKKVPTSLEDYVKLSIGLSSSKRGRLKVLRRLKVLKVPPSLNMF
jgi:hypothetical protein